MKKEKSIFFRRKDVDVPIPFVENPWKPESAPVAAGLFVCS